MAQGNVLGQSNGSSKINGIVEEYMVASCGNVNAGDFVKFVNEDANINTLTNEMGSISATAMSNNMIFIAYTDISSGLYGTVCEIVNNLINIKNTTLLKAAASGGTHLSVINLINTDVLIICRNNISSSSEKVYTLLCNFENDEITILDDTTLYNGVWYYSLITIRISENKVLYVYGSNNSSSDSDCRLCGCIVTIGEDSKIIKGTNTIIYTGHFSGYAASAVKLNDGNIFIVHSFQENNYSSNRYTCGYMLNSLLCNVDNDNLISITNEKKLTSNAYTGDNIAVSLIGENEVFITHSSQSRINRKNMYYRRFFNKTTIKFKIKYI